MKLNTIRDENFREPRGKYSRKVNSMTKKMIEKYCSRESKLCEISNIVSTSRGHGEREAEDGISKQDDERIVRNRIRESFGGIPSDEMIRASSPKGKLENNVTQQTVEIEFDNADKSDTKNLIKRVTFSEDNPVKIEKNDSEGDENDANSESVSPSSFDYSS